MPSCRRRAWRPGTRAMAAGRPRWPRSRSSAAADRTGRHPGSRRNRRCRRSASPAPGGRRPAPAGHCAGVHVPAGPPTRSSNVPSSGKYATRSEGNASRDTPRRHRPRHRRPPPSLEMRPQADRNPTRPIHTPGRSAHRSLRIVSSVRDGVDARARPAARVRRRLCSRRPAPCRPTSRARPRRSARSFFAASTSMSFAGTACSTRISTAPAGSTRR